MPAFSEKYTGTSIFCHLQGLTRASELLWYSKLSSYLLMCFGEEILGKWPIYTQKAKMNGSRSLFNLSGDDRGKDYKY